MLNIIIIMSVGSIVGYSIRNNKNVISLVDKGTTYAIWLLLFLLGLSVGGNNLNIRSLGVTALLLSSGAILGSVILSYFLFISFFKHKK